MFFRISLLLRLMVNILIAVSQDGVDLVQLPNREQSVLLRCSSLLGSKVLNGSQHLQLLPLHSLCHPAMEKYLDCMSADIYKAKATIDIQMRSVTNFRTAKSVTRKLCSEALRLTKEGRRSCNISAETCRPPFRPSGRMEKDSPAFCKLVEDRRCTFKKFESCNLQRAMLWAKYHEESLSIGCLLSDPKIQLFPSYGPELKCYSSINIDHISDTDYMEIYKVYCDQFDYNYTSRCTEESLSDVTSEDLWEDKGTYLLRAVRQTNERRELCEKMMALSRRTCFIAAYKPNVSLCKNMLFVLPGSKIFTYRAYLQLYAYCVLLTYLPCNSELAWLMYNHLEKYRI